MSLRAECSECGEIFVIPEAMRQTLLALPPEAVDALAGVVCAVCAAPVGPPVKPRPAGSQMDIEDGL